MSAALKGTRDRFRSVLASTVEEVRAFLDTRSSSPEEHVRREEAALGAFTAGRVDATRFSALLGTGRVLPTEDAGRVERAFVVLQRLTQDLDSLLQLRVPPGASLRDAVADVLARIGRAFGASQVVAAVRAGTYDEQVHAPLLERLDFARWTARQRDLAPVLVADVEGADLRAPALSEFLDGSLKLVLRVLGATAPAPLARLIAPRTYVVQAGDVEELGPFLDWSGPGVAALVPDACARFRHDPAAGRDPAQRIAIQSLPADAPTRAVGSASVAQQAEELEHLAALSSLAAPPATATVGGDEAGRLAAWLLANAGLVSSE